MNVQKNTIHISGRAPGIKRIVLLLYVGCACLVTSCESFLDQQPISDLSSDKFWLTADDAKLGMAGIYSSIQSVFSSNYILWGDARSDNFTFSGTGEAQINYSINAVTSTMAGTSWAEIYKTIQRANLAIKYLPTINLPVAQRDHYLAQAYAIRAYMYFFIIRLWGDAPIWLEPYENINAEANRPRSPADQIVQDVILPDLRHALEIVDPGVNTVVEVNIGGILAMLTDVYMWLHDYEGALEASERLIGLDRYQLANGDEWKDMFLSPANSRGNIWSLSWNFLQDGPDGTSRQIGAGNLDPLYVMDPAVIERFHNDPKDIRTKLTFDSLLFANAATPNARSKRLGKFAVRNANGTFQYPQTTQSEYKLTMYRYADVLLLRAEALNRSNDKPGAFALLNEVRAAVGLDPLDGSEYSSEDEVEKAILDERQLELFAEGRRWFDLVRTGRAMNVMDPIIRERQEALEMTVTGFTDGRRTLLPIHRNVLINNPVLTQNEPYSF
ncbi:Starch-binding associating with outer membrane [Parapedobacter composti]|uniref:Starch-binding associating with outer membrane n=1 Tax=Parapedobacter composti TaxID=623281 RepID=A0A1I1E9Y4_9SPHI|nr:RagB/SusD family nutrient uptake outer membrane protein [Parapedobacter composti]SFB82148.1 Starch-binding associating with outer membrane [Parapedobacter composti]